MRTGAPSQTQMLMRLAKCKRSVRTGLAEDPAQEPVATPSSKPPTFNPGSQRSRTMYGMSKHSSCPLVFYVLRVSLGGIFMHSC